MPALQSRGTHGIEAMCNKRETCVTSCMSTLGSVLTHIICKAIYPGLRVRISSKYSDRSLGMYRQ